MAELVVHVQITPKTTAVGQRPDRLAPVDRSAFVLASAPARRGSAIVQRPRSPTASTDPRIATDLFA